MSHVQEETLNSLAQHVLSDILSTVLVFAKELAINVMVMIKIQENVQVASQDSHHQMEFAVNQVKLFKDKPALQLVVVHHHLHHQITLQEYHFWRVHSSSIVVSETCH